MSLVRRTGTGKTASFVLPILNVYDATVDHRLPQAIVLVPTRELAVQVRDEAVKLSHGQNGVDRSGVRWQTVKSPNR